MQRRLRIVVTGLIAHHPLGGVCWDYIQYPVGLSRLGHDVFYFEDSGEWPYRLREMSGEDDLSVSDCSDSVGYLSSVMGLFGLRDRWAYRCAMDGTWSGLSDTKRQEILETADLLVNVSGTLASVDDYARIPARAYIDTDPVFTQIKILRSPGLRSVVDSHTVHLTFGETLDPARFDTGHRWLPTRQPVLLDKWSTQLPPRDVFTTVMNWASYSVQEHEGRQYGQKDVEFVKCLTLAARVAPIEIEVAGRGFLTDAATLSADSADTCRDVLTRVGFRVVESQEVCPDFGSYRRYLQHSRGEWSVAKNGYVDGASGWFSCRSACYLAAGRPVVVQDTGFSRIIPIGDGVLTFKTVDEAIDAVQEVDAHYERHARAARDIAAALFDSDTVLARLIELAMNPTRPAIAA